MARRANLTINFHEIYDYLVQTAHLLNRDGRFGCASTTGDHAERAIPEWQGATLAGTVEH
jgi:hypothetical protein